MKKILELVGTLLGKDPMEFVNSHKLTENGEFENEEAAFSEIRKSFSTKFAEISKTAKDETLGRAKREVLTEKEKEFRSKYEVEGGNLDEILDNVVKKRSEGTGITEADVKNHPLFISSMQNLGKKLKETEENAQAKIKEFEKASFQSKLKNEALKAIQDYGYTLPDDAKKADFLINVMIGELNKNSYKEENGNLIVLGENDTVMRDEFQTPIEFKKHVEGVASLLFAQGQPQRQSPNNRNDGGGAGASGKWNVKNSQDYMEELSNLKDPKEIEAFKEHFKQAIESGAIK